MSGILINTFPSGEPPASSNKTDTPSSSDSLAASVAPDEPAPTLRGGRD